MVFVFCQYILMSVCFALGIPAAVSKNTAFLPLSSMLTLFFENIPEEKSWVEEACESIETPQCPAE